MAIKHQIILLFVGLLPVIIIGALFYFLDKHKDPLKALIRAFILGLLSTLLTNFLYFILIPEAGSSDGTFWSAFFDAFYNAAFHEELAKMIVFLIGIYFFKEFEEWYDGILYGVIIGLGFAYAENMQYFYSFYYYSGISLIIERSWKTMPLHALLGGTMGFFIGKAKFTIKRSKVSGYLLQALLIPIFIHGIFDFILMYRDYAYNLSWITTVVVVLMWFYVFKLKDKSIEGDNEIVEGKIRTFEDLKEEVKELNSDSKYDEAFQLLEKNKKKYNKIDMFWRLMGNIYNKKLMYKEASAAYGKAYKISRSKVNLTNYGESLLLNLNKRKGTNILKRIRVQYPDLNFPKWSLVVLNKISRSKSDLIAKGDDELFASLFVLKRYYNIIINKLDVSVEFDEEKYVNIITTSLRMAEEFDDKYVLDKLTEEFLS